MFRCLMKEMLRITASRQRLTNTQVIPKGAKLTCEKCFSNGVFKAA